MLQVITRESASVCGGEVAVAGRKGAGNPCWAISGGGGFTPSIDILLVSKSWRSKGRHF